eukprot:TRINITY_DN13553_c0_g1_i1.p1 TRINITY_DN13553_c0_g1~~TRINITY_DN13553_c0_g1_i1.p1  ORF type:complete len:421 (-),score=50.73 TRINITY_DN13553_c0_g1_i1:6-1268(-)
MRLLFSPSRALRSFSEQGSTRGLHPMQFPKTSQRLQRTDPPCIVQVQEMLRSLPKDSVPPISLAQGIVHWGPPIEAVPTDVNPADNSYGPDGGDAALVQALVEKVSKQNGLVESDIMVTAGGNQAFLNVLLATCDAGAGCVLFPPYYFNHYMALQMNNVTALLGPRDSKLLPDIGWLEQLLPVSGGLGAVVIVNPCNPTGTLLGEGELRRAATACAAAGVWLIVDNAYEDFVYDGREHHCVEGPNVINLFTFSKAYGMMGWRIGYIAYPRAHPTLAADMLKVQDTVVICPSRIGQRLALSALRQAGRSWVANHVQNLSEGNRRVIRDALEPLGTDNIFGGDAAIYYFVRLPAGSSDDQEVTKWLLRKHGICVLPGSAFGSPGYLRVSFANLATEDCKAAASRLHSGLTELVANPQVPSAE